MASALDIESGMADAHQREPRPLFAREQRGGRGQMKRRHRGAKDPIEAMDAG
jgi:hypothetical protein